MSNNDKNLDENLKKLEDEAYNELCQIIAEAMELQDVELLNARIAHQIVSKYLESRSQE